MRREKSESEKAAGKLISAIQKEWGEEIGTPQADHSEEVMGRAHGLLQARTAESMRSLLKEKTVTEFLGEFWVRRHPLVKPAIIFLEKAMERENA
ncbi:hypothetical protein ACONUD_02720 [Microbulbifer harenosus]|uniref:Uncharacterized protein n=1 Tax=Microbulbifer harenosus TaxID=2576840 RepID=A0ABY2UCM4_9GAMM|nr:hypothetical protein [Microbulbifer harenosus]TLM73431.1 hypothetical protein FDY93_18940 [Microbulbifer harenosus]